ncbi:MAG: helicase-related protein [Geminicoccaceae bacterium]
MLTASDIRVGALIEGGAWQGPISVLHVERIGDDAAEITWRAHDGRLGTSVLFASDLSGLRLAQAGRPFAFSADGARYQLAMEAQGIRLAYLFDPFLAVTTSSVEPLPHQITAVYGEMLRRQPLRFLLADDPGAGKTIMAGLLIKELIVRGDLRRCLIVAPGSLVEQWQDELGDRFGLDFDILSRDRIDASRTGNPFLEQDRWIVRLDQLSRSEELQTKLEAAPEFDLVVCDEAHRMSATLVGGEVKYTKRYQLGQRLGRRARHLLLMSATPHNGKQADFELFMALLDGDRFEGRYRDGMHHSDPSDMMRRLTKEELVTFAGRKLFPERRAYTVKYRLSDDEGALYAAVTSYVRDEMNRADRLEEGDGKRRQNVGFALQTLQRRLASSPAAIHESLRRRLDRLSARLNEERLRQRGQGQRLAEPGELRGLAPADIEELEDLPENEREELEEKVVDAASAAQTIAELEAEIATLRRLELQARELRRSGRDQKWQKLLDTLDDPAMTDAAGIRRKLIIFSEPRDTLSYLAERIRTLFGRPEAVVVIHGGVGREERRRIVEGFRNDPEVLVLIANDAAGEGVNLQRAHLMVNYDLPWNPNRIEQRFGRIHRIGQTEVCHLWNLVAHETREGEVYTRLLEKLAQAREALGGRVFDVLGRLFEERPLRELLLEAVRYGDDPARKAELDRVIDGAVDRGRLEELLAEKALVAQHLDAATVAEVRAEMERASARRLQPRFVQRFFLDAFVRLGGGLHRREQGRFEVTRVPGIVRERERDRQLGTREVVLPRYERICFDKGASVGTPRAVLICPGHPLLDAVLDVTLERCPASPGCGAGRSRRHRRPAAAPALPAPCGSRRAHRCDRRAARHLGAPAVRHLWGGWECCARGPCAAARSAAGERR